MHTIQVKDTLYAKLRLQAQEQEVSVDQLINDGLELAANMDYQLGLRVRIFSVALGIPYWLIVQNTLISDWARQGARDKNAPRALREFQKRDGEVVTGHELYRDLLDSYQEPRDPAYDWCMSVVEKARAEGTDAVFGTENQCCMCGEHMEKSYAMNVDRPGTPRTVLNMCKSCAHRTDLTHGIFGMVHGRGGEEAKVKT